jgi:polyhydroxybutyrate depolymerase
MILRLVALLGVVLAIAACAARGTAQPTGFVDGTSVHTISVGGLDRTYRVYKPEGLPASAPLVVMLHGGCCGRPSRDGIDDVAFITAAVADIGGNVGIDHTRVYATGISNGGMMSYTLACNTGTFAAIGPDSATQLDPCRAPHPTSVMHIHGTADRLIRYDGGQGAGVAHIDGPSVTDLNAFWRNVDQCGAPAATTDGPVTTSTAGCADNRSVVLITVDGGGHEWPAFATQTLWQFFAAHPG